MKKIILGLSIVFFASAMMAQNAHDYMEVERAALKTEKKVLVADAMDLTEAESKIFWPLYNEYNEKQYVINTKVYNTIMDYADNFDTMTDEKALELWNNSMKNVDELSKLKKLYFKKFQKVLPGKKVVRYFQVENKVWALINAQLALEIPLMEQ
ncbi:MAG: hypothetical protein L3J31_00865 [Bacteroidales bacterium]|nr:hypothetical protein [Bacteroidales bacterium]MCF6341342.1 hypothetical protein [Bacteroidales bacterium]